MSGRFVAALVLVLLAVVAVPAAAITSMIALTDGLNGSPMSPDVPDVAITITPYNPPIVIPESGGTLAYGIEAKNNEDAPVGFDIWTAYTLPNGNVVGPVCGPARFRLAEGWSADRGDLSEDIPGDAAPGEYTCTAYVGIYPDSIWDTDSFTFKKQADGGWYPQSPGAGYSLNAVSFADADNGWAVSDYNEIIHTANGGDTWYQQDDNEYYPHGYNDVCFVDAQTGWVVGHGYSLGGTILHTQDGGQHWAEQTPAYGEALKSVCFVDPNNGWTVGGFVDEFSGTYIRVIEHTADGGATWTGQLYQYEHEPLVTIHFVDVNNGWAAGGRGSIVHTTDGGQTWVDQDSGTTSDLYSVFFTDANTGWCVGPDGTALHTTDGGADWVQQNLGTTDYLSSVYFVDPNNGWIAGGGFYPVHPTILHTADGGTTWDLQDTGTDDDGFLLYDITFVDQNLGWASGGVPYPYEGVMLHTTDGGGSPTDPVLSFSPESYDFGEMYHGDIEDTTLYIWNSGTGTLTYNLTVDPYCSWLYVTPSDGFSTGEEDPITITVDASALHEGEYQANVLISSNGGEGVFTVHVTIVPSEPKLSFSPTSYDFGDVGKNQLVTMELSIWNSGTGVLWYWLDPEYGWIQTEPWSGQSTGEVDTITVMCFTSSLDYGPHECDVLIHNNDENAIFPVYVNVVPGK
jgi:photosystem II stability/assembly factor-like uncharacterized protein